MSIRVRFVLWSSGILFISLLSMGVFSYYEFVVEPLAQAHAGSKGPDPEEQPDLSDIVAMLAWCGVPALALAVGGGWWLMRKTLAPISVLTHAAESITEHDLGRHIPCLGSGDELDRLTVVFNAMTDRLNQSFQRMREFTLHASHELKTPLTVIHGEIETALDDPAISGPQRERLLSELVEIQRLTRIVDGLSLLTKADAGLIRLNLKPLQMEHLLQETLADALSLARPSGIEVALGECVPVRVNGDRDRLRQLLLNLADNAIKYNHPGGFATLSLRCIPAGAEITVSNTGHVIPAEILPRVFDRFFRGDPSHNNDVEGCGLGLSIAQWIVQAHGGSISITSEPRKLTVVTVVIPHFTAKL